MLKITDLAVSKNMESREMAEVRGGMDPFAVIDFSTGFENKVADVTQAFNFQFAQGNLGAVTNNQAIQGGNGTSLAPVHQTQTQNNHMSVSGVGNVSIS